MADANKIKNVEGLDRWLADRGNSSFIGFALFSEPKRGRDTTYQYAFSVGDISSRNDKEIIKRLYSMKIGEVGSYWDAELRIEYEYAKIKFGDVFNYYTSNDGTLRVPAWNCFKFAVDEYLENNPRRQ